MPIHDWTRVDAGTYHDFHQVWTIEIRNALNRGILPPGYSAFAELKVSGAEPDVATIQTRPIPLGGGLAVADAPPADAMRPEQMSSVFHVPFQRHLGDNGSVFLNYG